MTDNQATTAPDAQTGQDQSPPNSADTQATDSSDDSASTPAPEQDDSSKDSQDGDKSQDDAEPEDLLFEKPKEESEDEDVDGDKDSDKDEGEEGDDSTGDDAVNVQNLTIPEDMPVPDALKEDLDSFAKEMSDPKISPQDKMQKAVDLHVKAQKHSIDVWNKTKQGWRDETLADQDVGGDKWEASQKQANAAIRAIWANESNGGSEDLLKEFQSDLKLMGLGNKKSFIKGMVNLSKMIGEDGQGDSTGAGSGSNMSTAEKLYGKDGKGRKA